MKESVIKSGGANHHESATCTAESVEEFELRSTSIGVLSTENEDIRSLMQ